jgi:hypothetical protein
MVCLTGQKENLATPKDGLIWREAPPLLVDKHNHFNHTRALHGLPASSSISHDHLTLLGRVPSRYLWPALTRCSDVQCHPKNTTTILFDTELPGPWNSTPSPGASFSHSLTYVLPVGSLAENSAATTIQTQPFSNCSHTCQHDSRCQGISVPTSTSIDGSYNAHFSSQNLIVGGINYPAVENDTTHSGPAAGMLDANFHSPYGSQDHWYGAGGLDAHPPFTTSPFDSGYYSEILTQGSFGEHTPEMLNLGCSAPNPQMTPP